MIQVKTCGYTHKDFEFLADIIRKGIDSTDNTAEFTKHPRVMEDLFNLLYFLDKKSAKTE